MHPGRDESKINHCDTFTNIFDMVLKCSLLTVSFVDTHCFGDIGLKSLIFFFGLLFSFLFFFRLLGLLIHYSLTTDVNILGKNRVPAVRT